MSTLKKQFPQYSTAKLTTSKLRPIDHSCKFDGLCHDGEAEDTPTQWHRLETMLSAWLDLIERGKVVALHYSVGMSDRKLPIPEPIDEATGARQEWTD